VNNFARLQTIQGQLPLLYYTHSGKVQTPWKKNEVGIFLSFWWRCLLTKSSSLRLFPWSIGGCHTATIIPIWVGTHAMCFCHWNHTSHNDGTFIPNFWHCYLSWIFFSFCVYHHCKVVSVFCTIKLIWELSCLLNSENDYRFASLAYSMAILEWNWEKTSLFIFFWILNHSGYYCQHHKFVMSVQSIRLKILFLCETSWGMLIFSAFRERTKLVCLLAFLPFL